MRKQFQFFFDGELVSNPIGWEKMIESLTRDKEAKGIFITHDVTLQFTGDAYIKLWNKKMSGFCSTTELGILESCNRDGYYELIYEAVLFTSDIEFDQRKCVAKVKINDNTFFAKINNNKSLECFLTAGKSKNGIDITPCPRYTLRLFNPLTGTYNVMDQLTACFKPYDVLKYFIQFMTDDEVEFDSVLFGPGGDFENLVLTFGYVISEYGLGNQVTDEEFRANIQTLKYQTIFQELHRRLNLGFYFDLSGAKPKILIEKHDDTKLEEVIVDIPKIKEITASFFTDRLYSSVKYGTTVTESENVTVSFPETIRFVGFKTEEYNVLGKCNLDNALDLQTDFISSSNVIQMAYAISPSDTTYDKNWFFIDCEDDGGVMKAKQSNWITMGPPYFYNERLTNENVSLRFLGAVPNSISLELAPSNNKFRATSTVAQPGSTSVRLEPVLFDDDFTLPNNDPGLRYDPATGRYTALNGGAFTFYCKIRVKVNHTACPTTNLTVTLYARKFDDTLSGIPISSHNIQQFLLVPVTSGSSPTFYDLEGTITVNLSPDYYIDIGASAISFPSPLCNPSSIEVEAGGIFQCLNASDGGGIYQTYDPNKYPIEKYAFGFPLSRLNYQRIKRNVTKAISFNDGKHFKQGWIDTLKYNLTKGFANITIIANKDFSEQGGCKNIFPPGEFPSTAGWVFPTGWSLIGNDLVADCTVSSPIPCYYEEPPDELEVGKCYTIRYGYFNGASDKIITLDINNHEFSFSENIPANESGVKEFQFIPTAISPIGFFILDCLDLGNTDIQFYFFTIYPCGC